MAWAHVQSTGTYVAGSSGSVALAFGSNITAGSLLVLAIHHDGTTGSISSITDSLGSTYNLGAGPQNDTTDGIRGWVYYTYNSGSGANTVTVNFDAARTGRYLAVHEYSGVETASDPKDVTSTNLSTTNSAAPTSGSATTTAANDLNFGFAFGGGTMSAAGGSTGRVSTNGDLTEDKNVATASSTSSTWTQSPSRPYAALMVTFKEPSAGGGVTVKPLAALGVG